jgi:hypothetical protein
MIGGECREPGVFFGPVWYGADAAVLVRGNLPLGKGRG